MRKILFLLASVTVLAPALSAQDVITLKNGDEIQAKVTVKNQAGTRGIEGCFLLGGFFVRSHRMGFGGRDKVEAWSFFSDIPKKNVILHSKHNYAIAQ